MRSLLIASQLKAHFHNACAKSFLSESTEPNVRGFQCNIGSRTEEVAQLPERTCFYFLLSSR